MLWRDMRGRTKVIHKELQDLDPLCSPHSEERWISGNIDLDLLSLFPQKYARIMGGMEEGGLIRLKRIYNFLCSMLVYAPFALCFVTLRGIFMHFPELTY
jgi:hypothetical protein